MIEARTALAKTARFPGRVRRYLAYRIPRQRAALGRTVRFTGRLRRFLAERITLADAQEAVRLALALREANFLHMVRRAIFDHPGSPYRPLLEIAGCEMGDIENMVRARGLEGTLRELRQAGVYIAFEEFKGRMPIVRGGREIPVKASNFDNPLQTGDFTATSGGSTGRGTNVVVDLDHTAANTPGLMLAAHAHGTLGLPCAVWRGLLPDGSGIGSVLRSTRYGHIPERWFTQVTSRQLFPQSGQALLTYYIVLMCNLFGTPIPWPRPVLIEEAVVVARWAAKRLRTAPGCEIRTTVGRAARVCTAASDAGLDLTGAVFWGASEPPTPGKVRAITATGARWIPNYFFTEAGAVGIGCVRPVDENDNHVFSNAVALIQHPRNVPGSEVTVDAFHFTSLLPSGPKVLLNVESDDYGILEERSCGCPLEAYGFTRHVRQIRSFKKLTAEGGTLVGSRFVRILEEVLPARFGGSPIDYQVVEEEADQSQTRLTLRINPRVSLNDESAVINAVLEALPVVERAMWRQAGTFRIQRATPIWTPRGKFLPIIPMHLARQWDPAHGQDK